jgi:Lhr-like helicase
MLLTRRLERLGLDPLGFVANDYAISVWTLKDMARVDLDQLLDQDMLGDDLEEWLEESVLMKRTFRTCAVIAGLIEQNQVGKAKTGRQVTFSSDLIFDVLRRHQPDHILLAAARYEAGEGLLDIRRLSECLARIAGQVRQNIETLSVDGLTAREQMRAIGNEISQLQIDQQKTWKRLGKEIAAAKIFIVEAKDITKTDRDRLEEYFLESVQH